MTVELVGIPADGGPPEGQLNSTELENIVRALNGAGVLVPSIEATVSGLDRIVTIPAFTYWAPDGAGALVECSYPGGTVTIDASDPDPRTDIIVAYDDNTVGEVAGVATPIAGDVVEAPMPALPANAILVSKVAATASQGPVLEANVQGRAVYVGSQQRAGGGAVPVFFENLLNDYALIAQFDSQMGALTNGLPVGLGLMSTVDTNGNLSAVDGRGGLIDFNTSATANAQAAVTSGGGADVAYGDRNPHFACILTSSAANAATKVQGWGFNDTNSLSGWTSTTNHKAMFRQVTTGALFAVTGNGSSEQVTSLATTLGAAHTYEVYTEDDGVTWVFKVDGVVVATHTTQVPGSTTGMQVVVGIENNTTAEVKITNCDLIYAYADRS